MKYLKIKKNYYLNRVIYSFNRIFKINFKKHNFYLVLYLKKYIIFNLFLYFIYIKTSNILLYYTTFTIFFFFINVFDDNKLDNTLIRSLNINKKIYFKNLLIYENMINFIFNYLMLILLKIDIVDAIFLSISSSLKFTKFINKKIITILTFIFLILTTIVIYVQNLAYLAYLVVSINVIFFLLIDKRIINNLYIANEKKIFFKKKIGINKLLIIRNLNTFNIYIFEGLIMLILLFLTIYYKNNPNFQCSINEFINNYFYLILLVTYLLNQLNTFELYDKCDNSLKKYSFYNKYNFNKERLLLNIFINSGPAIIISITLIFLKIDITKIFYILLSNVFISIFNYFIYYKLDLEKLNIIYITCYIIISFILIIFI